MPRYTYKCLNCDYIITVWHSIKENKTICTACEEETLIRMPPNFTIRKTQKTKDKHKVGDVVKSSIESFREDLEKEKEKLKDKEYEEK